MKQETIWRRRGKVERRFVRETAHLAMHYASATHLASGTVSSCGAHVRRSRRSRICSADRAECLVRVHRCKTHKGDSWAQVFGFDSLVQTTNVGTCVCLRAREKIHCGASTGENSRIAIAYAAPINTAHVAHYRQFHKLQHGANIAWIGLTR